MMKIVEVVNVHITGRNLLQALEEMLRSGGPNGAQPHLSRGCAMSYVLDAPPLHKLRSLTLHNAPLDVDREYSLAITAFMAVGGDGVAA
jgi:2',3'-cyclic-nucleotide 2'-phosphodiesterase (5'-nucleotidase family)